MLEIKHVLLSEEKEAMISSQPQNPLCFHRTTVDHRNQEKTAAACCCTWGDFTELQLQLNDTNKHLFYSGSWLIISWSEIKLKIDQEPAEPQLDVLKPGGGTHTCHMFTNKTFWQLKLNTTQHNTTRALSLRICPQSETSEVKVSKIGFWGAEQDSNRLCGNWTSFIQDKRIRTIRRSEHQTRISTIWLWSKTSDSYS